MIMGLLAGLLLFVILVLQVGFMYLLVPFILLKVLAVFGISISFLLAVGIMFVVYLLIGLLK